MGGTSQHFGLIPPPSPLVHYLSLLLVFNINEILERNLVFGALLLKHHSIPKPRPVLCVLMREHRGTE